MEAIRQSIAQDSSEAQAAITIFEVSEDCADALFYLCADCAAETLARKMLSCAICRHPLSGTIDRCQVA